MLHVAIAGNIGAGKTTLAGKLAEHFNWEVSFESVEDNPYLEDFYADMHRWSFHLQIYFLNHRFNQVAQIKEDAIPTIQDRTIYEDAHVFAKNLYKSGIMSRRDYQNYLSVFKSMMKTITPPDLLIYLKADVPKLVTHIQKRGREFEANMPQSYLSDLNDHYEEWIGNYNLGELMVVEVNQVDWLNNSKDWANLVVQVEKQCAPTLL
jgi:deoxyadenosine/deoxycytidine kinase